MVLPIIKNVNKNNAEQITFLNRFSESGSVDSPLFLKRIIAVAQMIAQINDKISPEYGRLIN